MLKCCHVTAGYPAADLECSGTWKLAKNMLVPIILIYFFTIFLLWPKEFKINSRGYLRNTNLNLKKQPSLFFSFYFLIPQVINISFALKSKLIQNERNTQHWPFAISFIHTLLAQQSPDDSNHETNDNSYSKGEPFLWIEPHAELFHHWLREQNLFWQLRVKDSM